MLTMRQRNELFKTVVAEGLEPAGCELQDPSSYLSLGKIPQVTILHAASSSHFTIWQDAGEFGYNLQSDVGAVFFLREESCAWDRLVEDYLAGWAREVAYESKNTDLWAAIKRQHEVAEVMAAQGYDNASFTPAEQTEISARLDSAKVFASENLKLASEQLLAIEHRLDELKEASTRVGRKDWLMMAQGAIYGLIANDLVPAHAVQSIFHVVIGGLAHLFGVGGPPPIISA
jgi:hypothetical protein